MDDFWEALTAIVAFVLIAALQLALWLAPLALGILILRSMGCV